MSDFAFVFFVALSGDELPEKQFEIVSQSFAVNDTRTAVNLIGNCIIESPIFVGDASFFSCRSSVASLFVFVNCRDRAGPYLSIFSLPARWRHEIYFSFIELRS